MKTIKIKKIFMALSMIGLTSLTTIVDAQWAVSNVNDPLYFGPTGIFTQTMAQMQNSVKASVDQVATLTEVSRKQALQLQQDTDARNRMAMGQAAIAAKNVEIFPTLQACAELTQQNTGAGSMAAAYSGGSSGGTGKKKPLPAAAEEIKTEVDKQIAMLKEKETLGTCSTSNAKTGVGKCTAVGDFGGSPNIPSSDVSSLSIKGNTSNADKTDKNNQEIANFSLNPKAIDVANQYIQNATLYNAPKSLPDDKAKANPGYQPLYDSIMLKLNGAQQALKDILAMRKAPNALQSDSLAKAYWDQNSKKYKSIFGMKAPELPSLADLMNFNAANDYVGVPNDTAKTQEELLKEINKKLALNNMIAVKQLSQQENTNILLALMLTQAVTPVNSSELNNQYGKIMNANSSAPAK